MDTHRVTVRLFAVSPPVESSMDVLEEKYSVAAKDDPSLVTVTSQPGFTSAPSGGASWFNGIENLSTREVTVTGVCLSWDGSVRALSALTNTRDITRLTLIADEVRIAQPLFWKGADVTIIARRLIFRDQGCITTTPEPYGVDAFSKERDDAGLPLDPATKQVKTLDGLPGCRAGSITLKVGDIDLGGTGVTRFDCRGGDGQKGEKGGYMTRPDKKPIHANPVSIEDIDNTICDSGNSTGDLNALRHWHYPRGGTDQVESRECRPTTDLYGGLAFRGLLAARKVTHVRLVFSYFYGINNRNTGVDLPSHRRGDTTKLTTDDVAKPHPPIAFASGKTGAGGAGGALIAPSSMQARMEGAYRGEGGASVLSDAIPGKSGTPEEYYILGYQFAQNWGIWGSPPDFLPVYLCCCKAEVGPGCSGSAAGPAAPGSVQAPSGGGARDWLDERLIGLMVTRARHLLSMGHRDDALKAIIPYYRELKTAHVTTPALETSHQSVDAITTAMSMNLDLYGHPAGWVPRFSADSYFKLYVADRNFSYKFCYVMNKAMALADSNERAWQVLATVASQTDAAIDQIHSELGTAYADFHMAQGQLQTAIDRMQQFEAEMDGLKSQAESDAMEKEKRDRIIKAVFNTAGAICKAVPVGQPYLSGVSSVLSGVGDAAAGLDASESGPEQALSFLSNLSGNVASTLDKSAGAFKSQFDDNLKQKYEGKLSPDELDLKKQIQVGRNQLALAEGEADKIIGPIYDQVTADDQLKQLLSTQADAVDAAAAAAGDANSLRKKLEEYNRSIAEITPAARNQDGTIGAELAAKYRQNLVAAKSKLYAQLADLDNVVVAKRKAAVAAKSEADRVKTVSADLKTAEAARQKVADQKDKLEKLLANCERKNDAKADADAKATFAKAIDVTQKVASGISTSAASIRDALKPISADDQDIQKLRDKILSSGYGHEFNAALEHLAAAKEVRAKALQGLQDCSQRMLTGIANLHRTLNASVAISRNRQALAANIDAGVRDHMQAMSQAAAERMDYYLYLVRKAYMYEQLEPAGEGLARVNEFTQRFDNWLANNRKPLPSGTELPAAADRTAHLAAMEAVAGRDFGTMGDLVLAETLSELAGKILARRQQVGGEHANVFPVSLGKEHLATLGAAGKLNFASMVSLLPEADWPEFITSRTRLRVSNIAVERFEVTPSGNGISQPIRLELTMGRTFPLRDDKGKWRLFRLADREKPMGYGYMVSGMKKADGDNWVGTIKPDATSSIDDLYKTVMAKATGQTLSYTEMAPSLLSSLALEIVMGRKQIEKVAELTIALTLRFD